MKKETDRLLRLADAAARAEAPRFDYLVFRFGQFLMRWVIAREHARFARRSRQ